MLRVSLRALVVAALLTAGVSNADPPPPAAGAVDPKQVDEAIDKGAKHLLGPAPRGYGKVSPLFAEAEVMTYDELVLFTLVHAGVNERDAGFQAVLDRVLKAPLKRTYDVSLKACALEALDAVKYRAQIVQCAQFLVDNQCKNGQWYYSDPVPLPPAPIATSAAKAEPKKTVETEGARGAAGGSSASPSDRGSSSKGGASATRIVPHTPITRRNWGPPTGDNSNTQYAILGLMACQKAGCVIPSDVYALTEKWMVESQRKEGGWGYDEGGAGKDCTGSMSCGIGGSLAAVLVSLRKHHEAKDTLKDARVAKDARWIGEKFAADRNPGGGRLGWHFYYLYALERAGAFMGTEAFGSHDWYAEGARWLLADQKPNGAWGKGGNAVSNTCFAILFLRRATRKLQVIYTQPARVEK